MPARALSVVLGILAVVPSAHAGSVLVTNLGDVAGVCPSPTACTLRSAIAAAAAGDTIRFDPSLGSPATITLGGTALTIGKDLVFLGPGTDALAISAANSTRVLTITSGNVTVRGLTVRNGRRITTSGPSGGSGTGGNGASAGIADGGCIRVGAGTTLLLERVAVTNCLARAGNGGSGGSGNVGAIGGDGGVAGSGGDALGGAIAVFGTLSMIDSSIDASAAEGGDGGIGGAGHDGTLSDGDGGTGGNGGMARGGAIHVESGGALLLRNTTLAGNTAEAGRGQNGGLAGGSNARGGDGGDGGDAEGGQVYLDTSLSLADLEFASLGPAQVLPGQSGLSGSGGDPGQPGVPGTSAGEVIVAGSVPRVRSSVLVGSAGTSDCQGSVMGSGANLDSDNSCAGFTLQGTFAANFAGPAVQVESGRAVLRPTPNSIVIDAASNCLDLNGATVTNDQNGRMRPFDGDASGSAACDVGATEFSPQLFADGFE